MTRLRQDAIELLEQMPEDKLIFMIQIMKGVRGLYKDENQEAKDLAFESLEKLRKKFSDLDYDKELAEYREGKYENLSWYKYSVRLYIGSWTLWWSARCVVKACKDGTIKGCIAAHSISNMFFILRKVYAPEERRILLKSLCTLFEVESIDKRKIERALLNKEFSDFKDCLQMECALSFGADYIVSRNPKDFQNSKVPCIDPKELVVKEHI